MLHQTEQLPSRAVPVVRKRSIPIWKRTLDIVALLLSIPVSVPLGLLVAVYIKIVSPGPVFFVQSRVGFGGDEFSIYKFRTMRVPDVSRDDAHRDYVAEKSADNAPIVKPSFGSELILGGRWLRMLSIDELPQLLNVLQGNMSLVGPRPDLLRLEDYQPWQTRRFEVLPGITGLWQVSGKNRLTFEQMIELDLQYVEKPSLSQDLKIMAKTFVVLLVDRNE